VIGPAWSIQSLASEGGFGRQILDLTVFHEVE
jgi:hypothetical protein